MTKNQSAAPEPAFVPDFDPAERRPRHDGWTPERQHDFIAALAASGCVTEACAAVGLSPSSAYRLRATPTAGAFRTAWDIALDYAIRRLSDAAFARALNGVSRPIFYQGEQIGERRYYDERLTQFMLRYRDPVRYGRWLDGYEARRHPDGAGITLAHALNAVTDAAFSELVPGADDGSDEAIDEAIIGAEEADASPADEDAATSALPDTLSPPTADCDHDDLAEPAEDADVRHQIHWMIRQQIIQQDSDRIKSEAQWARQESRGRGRRPAGDANVPVEDPESGWQSPLIVRHPVRARPAPKR